MIWRLPTRMCFLKSENCEKFQKSSSNLCVERKKIAD